MQELFRNALFTRLLTGRLVTNVGDSLYYIAAMWLVYDLTGSAFYTGLAGALTTFPQALQFLVGPLVDRWPIRRVLVATQLMQGVLVLAIPLAAVTGRLSVWLVLVVMPVLSMLNQFVYPAQSAALPRIVEDEYLVEANSAFSVAYQGVQTAFWAVGGVVVAIVGAIAVFALDAVTFAIAAVLFALVRIPRNEDVSGESDAPTLGSYLDQLYTGIKHVRGSVLVPILAGSVVVNFSIGMTMAVLPAFAALRGGSDVYGFMLGGVAGGMLVGALAASSMKRHSLAWLSILGFAASGGFWILAVWISWLPGTVALFALAWIPVGITNVVFAAMIQTVIPDELLGRITALNVSASSAATPLGSIGGGTAADVMGVEVVVLAAGLGFVALAGYWLVHPLLRNLPPIDRISPERFGLGTAETPTEPS